MGTRAVNNIDKIRKGRDVRWNSLKTHCAHGHPYDEENTRFNNDWSRACRACGRFQQENIRRKKRGLQCLVR